MRLPVIFGTGIACAVAGLAFSLCPNVIVQLPGAFLTLAGVICGVVLYSTTRKMPVDEAAAARAKVPMGIIAIVGAALALGSIVAQYKEYPWHHQMLAVAMFFVCMVILMQPRTQGKI